MRCPGIEIPNNIQPWEYSRGGGIDGASYISDGNPSLLGTNRLNNSQCLNAYNAKLDNRWNRKNGFATLFISLLSIRQESFVLTVVHSNHQASYRSRLIGRIKQDIFCYLKILFPKVSWGVVAWYQVFWSQSWRREFSLLSLKSSRQKPIRLFLWKAYQFVRPENVDVFWEEFDNIGTMKYN